MQTRMLPPQVECEHKVHGKLKGLEVHDSADLIEAGRIYIAIGLCRRRVDVCAKRDGGGGCLFWRHEHCCARHPGWCIHFYFEVTRPIGLQCTQLHYDCISSDAAGAIHRQVKDAEQPVLDVLSH